MTTLFAWIEDRIDLTLEKKLTQRHSSRPKAVFLRSPICPDFVRLAATHS